MGIFWLIIKGNDYYNINKKFEVQSTNIFGFQSKNEYLQVETLTAYPTPTPAQVGKIV